jgi:uroporphyrinogen-III synthase
MKHVVLTQPTVRSESLTAALHAGGWQSVDVPMSAIAEVPDLDWPELCATATRARWVLFPSPGAIAVVMAALERQGMRWPEGPGIGLIGPGSGDMLTSWQSRIPGLARAVTIAPSAPPFDADRLLARPELVQIDGDTVMVLRRADGREAWLNTLSERGAEVIARSVYRMIELAPSQVADEWFLATAAQATPFALSIASADAGRRLASHVASLSCAGWLMSQPVLTQHPKIAQSLREQGWPDVREHPPGVSALLHALESLRKRHS